MPEFTLADIQGIGVVVFLVVSFVSWILNMKNQGAQPGNRNRNRPGRPAQAAGGKRPDALINELEMFLEEVTGRKPQGQKNNPQRPPVPAKKPPRPRPRPRVEQQRPAAVQQQKPQPKPRPKLRKQPAPAKPKIQPPPRRELGSNLLDHVDDYMGENRVDKHVEIHLADGVAGRQEKRIGQSVREHMGSSISHVPVKVEVDPPSATTASLIKMLRNPNSVRTAIMISEILKRPKSLRD
jgi:outer membrane biosynthesis protein TonB